MKDRETSRRYSEDTKRGDAIETPPKELFDAHELAGQLEQLLGQEAETLRRFENQELLKILHRKESLIRELAAKLNDLEKAKNGHTDMSRSSPIPFPEDLFERNRKAQSFEPGIYRRYLVPLSAFH